MDNYNQYGIIPIEERIENAYKSESGLYPHEIIVLSYASKYSEQDISFPGFWWYRYGIGNVKAILNKLFEGGFIKYASVEETVKHQTVPKIKELLKSHRLKLAGNKNVLIERVLQNISEEEIFNSFPNKYYEVTDLGLHELKSNQGLLYIHNNPINNIDIWVVNRWVHDNPQISVKEVIDEKLTDELKYALGKKDYSTYLNSVYTAIRFHMNHGQLEKALREIAHQIYFDINAVRVSQGDYFFEYSMKYVFPYSTATYKISEEAKANLANIKHSLNIQNDELQEMICDLLNDVELELELFNKKECASIAIYEMKNESEKIEQIYLNVESRIKEKYDIATGKKKELSEKEKMVLEKKEQILLDSFNVLKDNVKTNHEQLAQIMVQLQESQPETVIELWKYLLDKNWTHVVRDKEEYYSISSYLTSDLMKELTNNSGFLTFEKYFSSEPKILQAVYQYSPSLPPWSTSVIALQIKRKNFEKANIMLEYMYANKKNNFLRNDEFCNYCFSNIYKEWIESYITTSRTHYGARSWETNLKVSEDIFEFLEYWVDQIKDFQEKARTKVYLMELI